MPQPQWAFSFQLLGQGGNSRFEERGKEFICPFLAKVVLKVYNNQKERGPRGVTREKEEGGLFRPLLPSYPARHFKSGDNLEIRFCNFAPNFSRPFFGGEIKISPPDAEQMGSFCGSQKWTSSSKRREAREPAQIGLLLLSDQILSSTCRSDWKEGVQVGKVVEYLQLPSRTSRWARKVLLSRFSADYGSQAAELLLAGFAPQFCVSCHLLLIVWIFLLC